ncbi:hypothetical protein DERP_000496 [Dermatophagoides pteronyssinus]|uniref:Uncharacterized protein n=1 Tax=Dermatophagoides pteronyssinus TaxID=6956 RepID=A0ABQ8J0B6_DERPT|nr:hypothetical protein DERP_000496 [Dermatophagoides pteronyssinus]
MKILVRLHVYLDNLYLAWYGLFCISIANHPINLMLLLHFVIFQNDYIVDNQFLKSELLFVKKKFNLIFI